MRTPDVDVVLHCGHVFRDVGTLFQIVRSTVVAEVGEAAAEEVGVVAVEGDLVVGAAVGACEHVELAFAHETERLGLGGTEEDADGGCGGGAECCRC